MDDSTRKLLIIIGIVILVVLGLSTLAGGMMGGHMYTAERLGGRGWMWGLGMGLGGLMMLLFWGAVIAGIVLLVRQVAQSRSTSAGETPLDVLKRRYAAGEITREEYEQMRRDLQE